MAVGDNEAGSAYLQAVFLRLLDYLREFVTVIVLKCLQRNFSRSLVCVQDKGFARSLSLNYEFDAVPRLQMIIDESLLFAAASSSAGVKCYSCVFLGMKFFDVPSKDRLKNAVDEFKPRRSLVQVHRVRFRQHPRDQRVDCLNG